MKKTFRIISAILTIILAYSTSVCSFAADETDAKLYNIYGDQMLFQQNEKAVISGTAKQGSEISCKVFDAKRGEIAKAKGISDGEFKISFDAPTGSYNEYTIEMYQNGKLFDTLSQVVFGELWIAGGQSNMHLFLRYTKLGKEMMAQSRYGSRNIRILDMPLIPKYNGKEGSCPFEPMKDIDGANWFSADCEKVYNITSVGYSFAEKLQQELDMPVGILCDYLGGSSILPWLSRKAIDSDEAVKKDLGRKYIGKSEWKEDNIGAYGDMTALYNLKTSPLTPFHVAGMIWYQGESDCGWAYGRYLRAIELLQKSLSEDFDYKNEKMPIIVSAFADNNLGGLNNLRLLSAELGDFVQNDYSSRSLITISDVPLDYTEESQAVHPIDKQPVGERMATAAQSLVYGKKIIAACAPILKETVINGSEMFLTFENYGEGLISDGGKINGFTICGKNGVYLPADAEIVSQDTVKISNPTIENPVAAMFSQGLITTRSNLFSSRGGEKALPVSHTVTNRKYVDNIWQDFGWVDCENTQMWRHQSYEFAGFFDVWKAGNAGISIAPSAAYSGNAGLEIKASAGEFSVAPITDCNNTVSKRIEKFTNWNSDWRNFSSISLKLKNNGSEDVAFNGIKIFVSESKFLMPVVSGTDSVSCVVPADGEWHTYSFDLDDLRMNGKKSIISYTRKYLSNVCDVSFCFNSASQASLCFDDIAFSSYKFNVSPFKLFGFDIIEFFSKLFSR